MTKLMVKTIKGGVMKEINFKKECHGDINLIIERLTSALKEEGFGILTRIDLHEKFKEKLNKEIHPVVILGACNPELAYNAYQINSDVASFLPCNAVVSEISPNTISVELASPSLMMDMVHDERLTIMGREADSRLHRVLESL